MGNWLLHYAEYTKESESPEMFHLWTGLSILASAVRRNVWLNQGIYELYPHLYVILVGPPGKVAKSTTIRLGRALLRGVEGIKFGADAVTVEELFREIEKAGANDAKTAALTLHATELSDLIDPSGVKMIAFLTTIYDGDDKWKYATKGSGSNLLQKPCVNLLGGTTPDWIATGMPVQAIGHGFTSRCIFVFEDKPRFLNPTPDEPDKELVRSLINDLDHISRLSGEFLWDEGEGEQPRGEDGKLLWTPGFSSDDPNFRASAQAVYNYYYHQIYRNPPKDYRLETYHWRKKNHLLKVAMLISLAESDELVLRARDIHAAWAIFKDTEKRMLQTFSAVGKNEHASDLERILANIRESGGMSLQQIYEHNYAVGDEQAIGKIILLLMKMGKVQKEAREIDGVKENWIIPI